MGARHWDPSRESVSIFSRACLFRRGMGGVCVAMMMALAGCHARGAETYHEQYQARTELKTFQVEVPMPQVAADGGGASIAMVPGFLEDYHRRARSPMRVQFPNDPSPRERQAAGMLVNWLDDRGVDTVLTPTGLSGMAPNDGHVGLSYEAYVAVVPNCGDWTGETGWNPTNLPAPDFSCSYNRNIGLMLSDPGDLERARPTGPADTARQRLVVDKYRAGQPTATATPAGEAGSLTGIAD